MLELKKITKDYSVAGSKTTVLKGISLTFRNSEFISILGPSGCGKTTMLNIIGGLDKYTSGDLIINGTSTKTYSDRDWDTYRNHTIGFVFQSYNLIPHQTILKNVELALSIGGISKAERKKRAIDALTRVGLKDHLYKKPNQLSGGQCQRVSIARALVTNPDIILADEPTGALDTETSVQIMEILKQIAKERLVVMVTHNPDLAEKYSTRIVRMIDGIIIEDTNPVSEDEYKKLLEKSNQKENAKETEDKQKKKKSSMSLLTSTSLSASNLLTKKKRTFITSLACSIGIIGISVILSVSNGMSSYVSSIQQDSSSANYLTISNTKTERGLSNLEDQSNENLPEYPDNTDGVYIYTEDTTVRSVSKQYLNNEYIEYIENNIAGNQAKNNLTLGIQYTKSVGINMVSYDGNSYKTIGNDYWNEILDNEEYMSTQYTILSGTKMPTQYDEVSFVVDRYNRISSTILDQLGIDYSSTSGKMDYDSLIGKEFRLIKNDDYYRKQDLGSGKFKYSPIETQEDLVSAYQNGVTLKIVSIIRENKDASMSWVSSGIAYTRALTDKIIELNKNSEIVEYQNSNPEYNVLSGKLFSEEAFAGGIGGIGGFGTNIPSYEGNIVKLGGDSSPTSITIYPRDYDSKEKIKTILDAWNESEIYKIYGNDKDTDGNYIADIYKVSYTDFSSFLVSMMNNLVNTITYVLVAFSAISLVVSSIMIAIITYASVIERTKEIGTIRSLGGRKRDVSNVFIAEACIIGLVSAVIAIVATLGINAIINVVVSSLVGDIGIAVLSGGTIIAMLLLSVGLNLLASLIPARIAAKKDPVVALRTA